MIHHQHKHRRKFPIPYCTICMPRSSPSSALVWHPSLIMKANAMKKTLFQYIAIVIYTPGFKIRKMLLPLPSPLDIWCWVNAANWIRRRGDGVDLLNFQSPLSEVWCVTSSPSAHVSAKRWQSRNSRSTFSLPPHVKPPVNPWQPLRPNVSYSMMETDGKVFYF